MSARVAKVYRVPVWLLSVSAMARDCKCLCGQGLKKVSASVAKKCEVPWQEI